MITRRNLLNLTGAGIAALILQPRARGEAAPPELWLSEAELENPKTQQMIVQAQIDWLHKHGDRAMVLPNNAALSALPVGKTVAWWWDRGPVPLPLPHYEGQLNGLGADGRCFDYSEELDRSHSRKLQSDKVATSGKEIVNFADGEKKVLGNQQVFLSQKCPAAMGAGHINGKWHFKSDGFIPGGKDPDHPSLAVIVPFEAIQNQVLLTRVSSERYVIRIVHIWQLVRVRDCRNPLIGIGITGDQMAFTAPAETLIAQCVKASPIPLPVGPISLTTTTTSVTTTEEEIPIRILSADIVNGGASFPKTISVLTSQGLSVSLVPDQRVNVSAISLAAASASSHSEVFQKIIQAAGSGTPPSLPTPPGPNTPVDPRRIPPKQPGQGL